MIVAIIAAEKIGTDSEQYFKEAAGESAIERLAATVLRGPFGATLVAAHPAIAERVKKALNGFSLQFVNAPGAPDANALTLEALKAAGAFRTRWEKAMAAAGARFSKQKPGGSDWSKHKQNADVKVRGLARSFDRDGVMLIPADSSDLTKECIAELVENFAEGKKLSHPPGGPLVLSLEEANEAAALKTPAELGAWLSKRG